ncbi:MAG TPA: phage tail protein [Kofleriaceae bacterium]|nr:phage tail protein [Kofleriaceae bacterium]
MANANPSNRAYAAAHFALELDGKEDVGMFRSVEGGGVKADVMTYQPAPSQENGGYQKWRQLGKPKFDDIKLQVGMSMAQPFYAWLADFFVGKATRKTGAIVAADFYYNERARRDFKGAMIRELTFPKLDAADKNAIYMNISVCVEDIEFKKGSGTKLKVPEKTSGQKLWTACNFTFKLDGLDEACRRVTKIDSFTVKQAVAEYHAGGFKAAIKTPTAMEFPNLIFYVPEADAQPFMEHMQASVGFGKDLGKGKVRDPKTLNGSISTFDNENRHLLDVEFKGADIVSVAPEKSESTTEEVKLVKIELYIESMELKYPSAELE